MRDFKDVKFCFVLFVVALLCLTLQQLLCGLEEAVGWGQLRKLAAGKEGGMNNAGHSMGILTDPSFVFSH